MKSNLWKRCEMRDDTLRQPNFFHLELAFEAQSCAGSTSRVPTNVMLSAPTPSRIRHSATDKKDEPLSPGPSSTTMNLEVSRCCSRTQSLWLSVNSVVRS